MAPGTTPHQGKQSTKARNKRRNEHRKLKKLIELGVLPGNTNHAGYLKYLAGKQTNELPKKLPEPVKQPTAPRGEFEPENPEEPEKLRSVETGNSANRRKRYRKAFVKAKKSGTVPEGQDLDKWIEEREQKRTAEKEKGGEGDITLADVNESTERTPMVADDAPNEETSNQRRVPGRPSVNFDLLKHDAFHDHGIDKEKATATEEELMRKEWAQTHREDTVNKRKGFTREQFGKRPRKIIYDDDGNPVPVDTEDAPDVFVGPEDPNAWRKKLVLSAVECEWEGVELPLPNFPFKQPTFQNLNEVAGNKRKRGGGKGKKLQQREYWGGEDCAYGQDDGYYQQQQQGGWAYDHHDNTTNINDNQTADTTMEEFEPVNDLPSLPEDINSLPPLTKPVLPHTVIVFKQLTMDANYAPILADYRTAIVDEVDDQVRNGPFLVLKLAIRDRLKRNVDEMGEKILRKFEMPGNNDDDEGIIELMFGELLEPKVVKLPEILEASGAQDGRKDSDNSGESTMDGAADGAGLEEAMDDAPQEEHQDKTSGGEYHEPASGRGEGAVDGEIVLEEEAVGGKVASPHILLPEDEPATESLQKQDPGLQIDTPIVPQPVRTNSPVYSQDFREFKTPEPEAQRDVSMMDKPDYSAQATNGDPTLRPAYESDSDGLPTLEFILASQPQKILVKRESDNEPQLPLSPPFGAKVSDYVARSPEKSLDEQQIQQEVEGARNIKPGRGRSKKPTVPPQVQVIDLTVTSDPPAVENPRRKRPKGRGAKGDKRRAIKS